MGGHREKQLLREGTLTEEGLEREKKRRVRRDLHPLLIFLKDLSLFHSL